MSETAQAQGLTPEEAARTIEEARSYDEPLRRRTEGVTWMLWGFVTAGISLGFASIHEFFGTAFPPWWFYPLNLFGWVIVGGLATYALWRIAVLGSPHLKQEGRRSVLAGLLWLPLVYAAWGLILLLGPGLHESVIIPVSIGVAWTFLGGVNLFKSTPTGRRALIVIGMVILAASAVFAFATEGATERARWSAHNALLVFVGGGTPFLAGLWQSLRG